MSKQERVMARVIEMLDDGYDVEEVASTTGMPYEWVKMIYSSYYEEEDEY